MINQTETYVIDPEFAFYGPMGIDIGAVIGNLFLNYAAQEVRMSDPEQRADFQEYLTDMVIELWHVSSVSSRTSGIESTQSICQGAIRRILCCACFKIPLAWLGAG